MSRHACSGANMICTWLSLFMCHSRVYSCPCARLMLVKHRIIFGVNKGTSSATAVHTDYYHSSRSRTPRYDRRLCLYLMKQFCGKFSLIGEACPIFSICKCYFFQKTSLSPMHNPCYMFLNSQEQEHEREQRPSNTGSTSNVISGQRPQLFLQSSTSQ